MPNKEREPFASAEDFEECRKLHQKFGATYYLATKLFPKPIQRKTSALYGFVRVPDEWVDTTGWNNERLTELLENYRWELLQATEGVVPGQAALRAFFDVMWDCNIPLEEPLLFLDSMEQDLIKKRYETYEELQGYMRGSASAVGVMMCYILDNKLNPDCLPYAMKLGEAMQMTNFLRDVGEDAGRSRVYLPQEDLVRFGVQEADIFGETVTPEFRELMKFEIARTRELYKSARPGIALLPRSGRKAVTLASVLYGRILNRIEGCDYDVFHHRARTSKGEKLAVAARVMMGFGS